MFLGLGVYNFDKAKMSDNDNTELDVTIENKTILSENFKKICIIYSFAESVLIPFTLYNSAENDFILSLIHGDMESNTITLTDLIAEKEIYNTYRIPAPILKSISTKFPAAETRHQYSFLLKQPIAGDKLLIIFYSQKIVIRLNRNGLTEFINNYYYNAPEDVSYFLLNVCRQNELTNIPVEISGLIEKDSVLFKEIYKYFESVFFAKLDDKFDYTEEILQYPAHYFSHLFATDLCE